MVGKILRCTTGKARIVNKCCFCRKSIASYPNLVRFDRDKKVFGQICLRVP